MENKCLYVVEKVAIRYVPKMRKAPVWALVVTRFNVGHYSTGCGKVKGRQ
jgi:hypothetical protein